MKYTPANPIVIIFKRDGVVVDFARTANGKVRIYVCHPTKTVKKLGEGWSSVSSVALRSRINITPDLQPLLKGICL